MDDTVIRAMQKWPNVPEVFGWLRLDRRGNWQLRVEPDRFERVGNAAMAAFIGRNYVCDGKGRWYFQNGPQRVFAGLDYAPYVFRLDGHAAGWVTHCGDVAGPISQVLFDEVGNIVLAARCGVGVVDDRDLAAALQGLEDESGAIDIESWLPMLRAGQAGRRVVFFGRMMEAALIESSDLAVRFGFVREPQPEREQAAS